MGERECDVSIACSYLTEGGRVRDPRNPQVSGDQTPFWFTEGGRVVVELDPDDDAIEAALGTPEVIYIYIYIVTM